MYRCWFPVVLLVTLLVPSVVRADDDPTLDLSQVESIEKFPGDQAAKAHLAREGFVVLPRFHRQMFSLYIGGGIPYYVTCDSAHRTYQVLFESALQGLDRALATRTRHWLQRLHRLLADGHPLARAHVAVALRLFGEEAAAPTEFEAAVAAEVGLVTAAAGPARSPLFDVDEDYAAYLPRGYYAGRADSEIWFRVATWLGRRGFRVVDERETEAALSLVAAIAGDEKVQGELEAGSRLLDWLLGPPDDLTVVEYQTAIGRHPTGIREALAALRDPEINDQVLQPEDWRAFQRETKGLRLLPSRQTPDAVLFQVLNLGIPGRSLPSGLEVALALGSRRANTHLQAHGSPGKRAARTVRADIAGFSERLADTHYGATLRAAALLHDESSPLLGAGEAAQGAEGMPVLPAPCFASDAWRDRLLTTSLASWASLRHAWVLHAKRTVHYLGLTDEPPGVVEPAPGYFAALADLARSLVERLDAFGAFAPPDARSVLTRLLPVVDTVGRGDTPTPADMELLRACAPYLAEILLVQGGDPETHTAFARIAATIRSHLEGTSLSDDDQEMISWLLGALGSVETKQNLDAFAKLMDDLADIARRELAGEALTDADEALIRDYGKTSAQLNFWRGNSWLSPDKQMGLVVDVASDPQLGEVLEVAVGAPMELYVALPLPSGKYRLHRGGVYSYYEFPAGRPLTDAAWRARVKSRQVPALPAWTTSYVAQPDVAELLKRIEAGEIVAEVEHLHDPRVGAALIAALATGTQSSEAEDRRLAWVARNLAPYADGPARPGVVDVLVDRLLDAKGDRNLQADLPGEIQRALGRVLEVGDRPRLIAILQTPPPGSHPETRRRVMGVLLWARDAATPEEVGALLRHEQSVVRSSGVRLLTRQFLRRGRGTGEEVAGRLLVHLVDEKDAGVQGLVLGFLAEEDLARHVPTGAGAQVAPLLDSPVSDVRDLAIVVLGKIHAADQAGRLVELLETTTEPDRLADLARAVGGALAAAEGRDADLAARAVRAIGVLLGADPRLTPQFRWPVQVACLDGLAALGDDSAVAALGMVAADEAHDVDLRSIAIDRLSELGQAAVPYLFRMCFDEAETGSSVNNAKIRLCDEAAVALDRILEGELGLTPRWDRIVDDDQLESVRAEARRRGYGP